MAYQYTNAKGINYYLHGMEVTLRGSNIKRTIYFFAKKVKDGSLENLPEGWKVVENQRTGLPVLKRT